jgi:hypothetical protein
VRAFIVGNGPSLTADQLDLIAHEDTFGVNQCDLIYPETTWRPRYWVCTDRDLQMEIHSWAELFFKHRDLGERCYISPRHDTRLQSLGMHPDDVRKQFNVLDLCMEHGVRIGHREWWPQAWHLPKLCVFAGSVLTAIQLAVTMGYNELYVLGCDADYHADAANHFTPEYFVFRPYTEEWAAYLGEAQRYAHNLARRECYNRGVFIYNAGRGGKLEAYPRIGLEQTVGG